MKIAVKSPESAVCQRAAEHSSFQRFSFQHFSFTQIPLFPRNPHFPALRSGPLALSGASSRKQIPSSWAGCGQIAEAGGRASCGLGIFLVRCEGFWLIYQKNLTKGRWCGTGVRVFFFVRKIFFNPLRLENSRFEGVEERRCAPERDRIGSAIPAFFPYEKIRPFNYDETSWA